MNRHESRLTLDRFESLLEAYGGDFSRWPAGLVGEAAALVVQSPEARRRLAEAQALDRLLGKASGVDRQRLNRLADRILAATAEDGRTASEVVSADGLDRQAGHTGARIVRLPVPSRRVPPAAPAHAAAADGRSSRSGGQWRATAALAASLMLGIAIGLTDVGPDTTLNVTSLLQPSASEAEIVLSGLQIDPFSVVDEDQI